MKTHMSQFFAIFLIFSAFTLLHAESKGIAIAAYTKEKAALEERQRLEHIVKNDATLAKLQAQEGFTTAVSKSGRFNVVSIEPFDDKANLRSALKIMRGYYPDSYIVNAHISVEAEPHSSSNDAVSATSVAAIPHVEEIAMDDDVDEVQEETVETDASHEPNAEKRLLPVKPQASPGFGILPMVVAGVVILLVLLVIYLIIDSRRRRSALDQTDVSAAKEVLEHDEEQPSASAPAAEPEAPAVQEAAETPDETPQEEPVPVEPEPAASTRKKRDPIVGRGPVSKDSLRDFAGMRILVAEDNLINQKVINGLFAESGVEITMANDGQEALNILEKDSDFALILMDAHMPIIDGLEATRQIRANPDYEHIAVIALSGDTAADDIRKMTEAGMEGHLEKPIKVDALYDMLYCYQPGDEDEEEESQLPSTLELLSDDGLDVAGGDVDLYREILTEFAQMYADSDETLNSYLAKEEYESAGALLLDVHGVAANIGATPLSDAAEELREAILAKDETRYSGLSESYHEHLQALLRDIKKI